MADGLDFTPFRGSGVGHCLFLERIRAYFTSKKKGFSILAPGNVRTAILYMALA